MGISFSDENVNKINESGMHTLPSLVSFLIGAGPCHKLEATKPTPPASGVAGWRAGCFAVPTMHQARFLGSRNGRIIHMYNGGATR